MHRRRQITSVSNSGLALPRYRQRRFVGPLLSLFLVGPLLLAWTLSWRLQESLGETTLDYFHAVRNSDADHRLGRIAPVHEEPSIHGKPITLDIHRPKEASTNDDYHIIFSTDCSKFQDWQAYLFFHRALDLKQRGNITRIISGCTQEQKVEQKKREQQIMEQMSDRFRFHFTDDYGKDGISTGAEFQTHKYFNKPFGVRNWLEEELGYPESPSHQGTIVVLVDPDMLFLRPFENDFREYYPGMWRKRDEPVRTRVSHGLPVAQRFAYGDKWKTGVGARLVEIVGKVSPTHNMSSKDAEHYFPAGPPYILTMRDMYSIASRWTDFANKSYAIKPQMLAEMYGYSLAAGHLGLKHQLGSGFAMSDMTQNEGEGWAFIESVEPQEICKPLPQNNLPLVLHFCQRYSIGDYFFSKYKIPENIISCNAPLMKEPPVDAAVVYNYSHYGDGSTEYWDKNPLKTKKMILRNAFIICNLIPAVNAAATFYKRNNCDETANYDKAFSFFDESGAVIA